MVVVELLHAANATETDLNRCDEVSERTPVGLNYYAAVERVAAAAADNDDCDFAG